MSTRDRILSLFKARPGQFVSGQQLSSSLQISRAAVWKQIRALRETGLTIESKHGQGYRLVNCPDMLLAAEIGAGLNTRLIGHPLVALAEVDSTNTRVRSLAEEGGEEGLVVVADRQTAGRGRLGRCWESPAAVNLYCSVLLKPQIPVQQAPQLTFLSAVAVAETLTEVCGLTPSLKWPNDVLINGAKIAGLLNEMNAETEQIHHVVLGIGINLNMQQQQLPPRLNYPATSVLLETGTPVDRTAFARTLLQRLDSFYQEFLEQGFVPLRRRWEALCNIMNRSVSVALGPEHQLVGTVVGLDADGALRLQTEDGTIERILAGDVTLKN